MSLPDPFSVVATGTVPATTFSVISRDAVGTIRADIANGYNLKFSHSDPSSLGLKPEKHYMQLSQGKDVADPYTGLTKRQTATASISVTIPPQGWTRAQAVDFLRSVYIILEDSEVTAGNFLNFQS